MEGERRKRSRPNIERKEVRTTQAEEEKEDEDQEMDVWKRREVKMEEVRKKNIEEERNEKEREKERRSRRERCVIWWEIEGREKEERIDAVQRMIERILGAKSRVKWIEERKTEEIRFIIIEMIEKAERDRVMEKKEELRRKWDMRIDEDLDTEERENRRRIADEAREERRKGKEVEWTSRRLWLDGEEWVWESKEKGWKKKRGKEEDKDTANSEESDKGGACES